MTEDWRENYICCEHILEPKDPPPVEGLRHKGFRVCCEKCYPDFLLLEEVRDKFDDEAYREWRQKAGYTTHGKRRTADELVKMVQEMSIGFPDGTVLCDLCNKEIFDQDDVRMSIAFLDISKQEHQEVVEKLSRKFGRIFLSSPPGEPETYLGCLDCLPESIKDPTMGTDEWIVKGHIIYKEKFPRIVGVELLDHSPPEIGS